MKADHPPEIVAIFEWVAPHIKGLDRRKVCPVRIQEK